jgi:phosphoribosylglycinamide formyltransferase-1
LEEVLNSTGLQIAIMVSGHGRGTNLQALIDGCSSGRIPGTVAMVIGTRSDAPALDRARSAGIHAIVISPKRFEGDDDAYGNSLLRALRSHDVGLICLAGFMRILPLNVVEEYRNRIMNVHPALLPKFGGRGMYGLTVHEAVIASGETESGATVHLVDEHYDTGPIVIQRTVPVEPNDTPDSLAERVLFAEHEAYVEAVRLFAEGRIMVKGRQVTITNGEAMSEDAL